MPDTNKDKERHSPLVLVDTENLTREEWLEWNWKTLRWKETPLWRQRIQKPEFSPAKRMAHRLKRTGTAWT